MIAINIKSNKKSGKNSTLIVGGIFAILGGLLFAYLMFYTSPEANMEMARIVAVTESGCIAETLDGYSINIRKCNAQPGQYIDALVDQKIKERAAAMNPSN